MLRLAQHERKYVPVTPRLAVFDCDGTLVDSQGNICACIEETFVGAKLTVPDRAAIRRIVGLSLVEAMAVLSSDPDPALHLALAEDYKRRFQRMRADGTLAHEPLFDGIPQVLEALEADGWLLGVATGKSDRGLNFVLTDHGIAHHFVTLQTADRHPSKPDPAMLRTAIAEAGATPETTVMIGDTSYDIWMALNADVRAVGVGWGYHDADELAEAGAHAVAARVADLPGLLTA